MTTERSRDIAHVGAVELLTAVPEQTAKFFVALLGMSAAGRAGVDHVNYLAHDIPEIGCFMPAVLMPVTWTAAERAKGQAWGLKTIDTFHTHGTPPADVAP